MNTLTVMQNAEERDDLSQEYATMSEEFGKLTSEMDALWLEKRAFMPDATDTFINKTVSASELGKRYHYLKYKMKGYEKRISSLNSIITVANNEARGFH